MGRLSTLGRPSQREFPQAQLTTDATVGAIAKCHAGNRATNNIAWPTNHRAHGRNCIRIRAVSSMMTTIDGRNCGVLTVCVGACVCVVLCATLFSRARPGDSLAGTTAGQSAVSAALQLPPHPHYLSLKPSSSSSAVPRFWRGNKCRICALDSTIRS